MKIDIKHLAQLANVQLSEKQEQVLEKSIPSIIEYMDEIRDLDVDAIPETSRVTEEINVFREDVIEPSFSQKEALKNAKKSHNGFFLVPAILEKEE